MADASILTNVSFSILENSEKFKLFHTDLSIDQGDSVISRPQSLHEPHLHITSLDKIA